MCVGRDLLSLVDDGDSKGNVCVAVGKRKTQMKQNFYEKGIESRSLGRPRIMKCQVVEPNLRLDMRSYKTVVFKRIETIERGIYSFSSTKSCEKRMKEERVSSS
jgi:hypothetical protein